MGAKRFALDPKQNCHPDRSEAQWRDLRFLSPALTLGAPFKPFFGLSGKPLLSRQMSSLDADRKHRRECLAGRLNREINVSVSVSGTEERRFKLRRRKPYPLI